MCTYCFLIAEGKPAPAVALINVSTFVFASSKVTTASAFSRLTSAVVTPLILVKDLFTEVTHALHVIPDTESVTVLISANAAAETTANRRNMAALISFFTVFSFSEKVGPESPNECGAVKDSGFRSDSPHTTETPPARQPRSRRR